MSITPNQYLHFKKKRKESKTRDLDHIMGSRFEERTGLKNKCVTEREWQKIMEDKYGTKYRTH